MNAVVELLKSHRSIRKFTDEAITPEVIETLVQCGQAAATSSNVQAVTVIHVTDSTKRAQIAELAGNQNYVNTAGAFLMWCADLHRPSVACQKQGGTFTEGMTEHFIIATVDVALAAQNAAVAAESMGLGICYIGGIRNDPSRICDILQLPENVYPVFGMCIGHPAQDPETKPRMPVRAVLMENSYSDSSFDEAINDYDEAVRHYYLTRTGGNKDSTWSEEMRKLVGKESRPHMKGFLNDSGFLHK